MLYTVVMPKFQVMQNSINAEQSRYCRNLAERIRREGDREGERRRGRRKKLAKNVFHRHGQTIKTHFISVRYSFLRR